MHTATLPPLPPPSSLLGFVPNSDSFWALWCGVAYFAAPCGNFSTDMTTLRGICVHWHFVCKHYSPPLTPPPSHSLTCVCECSVSGLVCLQIVFTVDRATQNRTQPKGNKSNAPTLLLRFYTANKHTSHTHTHPHTCLQICAQCVREGAVGEGGGGVERARLCIVFMC